MSKFRLESNFPDFNERKFSLNENTIDNPNPKPKCISEWKLSYGDPDNINQSLAESPVDGWYVRLYNDDELTIPFKAKKLDKLKEAKFVIQYKQGGIPAHSGYITIETYKGNQFDKIIIGDTGVLTDIVLYDYELENAEYIKIIQTHGFTNNTISIYLSSYFQFETNEYDITFEKNDTDVNLNLKTSKTIDYKNYTTKLKETEVYYKDIIRLDPEEAKELEQLITVSSLNNIKTDMMININEIAIDTLAGIGAGGASNWIRFFYLEHNTTQTTGLFTYIQIKYKSDLNLISI